MMQSSWFCPWSTSTKLFTLSSQWRNTIIEMTDRQDMHVFIYSLSHYKPSTYYVVRTYFISAFCLVVTMMGMKWEGHTWSPAGAKSWCVWVGPWERRSPGTLRVVRKRAEVWGSVVDSPPQEWWSWCIQSNAYRVRMAAEEARKARNVGWDRIMKALWAWLRHTDFATLFV